MRGSLRIQRGIALIWTTAREPRLKYEERQRIIKLPLIQFEMPLNFLNFLLDELQPNLGNYKMNSEHIKETFLLRIMFFYIFSQLLEYVIPIAPALNQIIWANNMMLFHFCLFSWKCIFFFLVLDIVDLTHFELNQTNYFA